ncbi:MAG: hypothetical protein ACRD3D_15115 [Terriglobia bacterium]
MENYFNYFTEVEECFRRQRGTPSLLSSFDWALIESWKEAGITLAAVCTGIERAFEKYARRPRPFAKINGLSYCAQEVMTAADEAARAAVENGTVTGKLSRMEPAIPGAELVAFVERCREALLAAAERMREAGEDVMASDLTKDAEALREVAAQGGDELATGLENLERTLTAIEERLCASLTRGTPVEVMVRLREEVDRGLATCRRTMTAAQIELVERQFLKKRLFEHYRVPRLSLFYR